MNESEPSDEVSKITQLGDFIFFSYEYGWIDAVDNQCLGGIERSMSERINLTQTLAGD